MNQTSRKFLFGLVTLALLLALIEVFGVIGYGLVTGRMASWNGNEAERVAVRGLRHDAVLPRAGQGPIPSFQILHPYLGFVLEPSPVPGHSNQFGFTGPLPRFESERADDAPAVVAVFGGSVAQQMVDDAVPVLRTEIGKSACFAGREIEVLNLALPGVKQPQQLMTLNYFASLGATIDVVVALDGFNEVVLPVAENERQGVFPFYPRNWRFQVAGLKDVPTMRSVGEIEFLRGLRGRVAQFFSQPPLAYSFAGHLVWWAFDRELSRSVSGKMIDLTLAEGESAKRKGAYYERGPERTYGSDEERYRDLAAVWGESIRLMEGISRQQGMSAHFFLQPNQRVEGSKVFAPGEREIALPARQSYDLPARRGYPELIRVGEALRAEGLPFHDLTMVFRETPEPVYVDGCCHVSPEGSEIMAREIGRAIRKGFEEGAPCPTLQ
jgi:hypothetical protein